jgi:hypothetical protein
MLRDTKPEKIRAQFVSGGFSVDGGLEKPPAGTIACPTGRPTAHLGMAKAERQAKPPAHRD